LDGMFVIFEPKVLSRILLLLDTYGRNLLLFHHTLYFFIRQHMDIMDGHFVPNLTFGPPVIASLRKAHPDIFIDCHLMVTDPIKWIEPLRKAGASSCTFHIESTLPDNDPKVMIQCIRDAGMKVGMVIKPGTPVDTLFPYVNDIDLVLIMTVEPGFSGQSFMSDMMSKVRILREKYPELNIQVDGGIGPVTIDVAAEAGANVIVAASAIFESTNRKGVINTLRTGVEKVLAKSRPTA
jgi:ribulose-phosphate 3-epimerase